MQAQEVVTAKPWYKSWTILFNGLAGASMLLDWIILQDFAFINNPIFGAIVTAVNFALRFKTDRPVAAVAKTVVLDDLKG